MNPALEYLLSYLSEDFSAHPEVRVRLAPEEKPERSPDLGPLPGDEERPLRPRGVFVKSGSREYFFPESWVTGKNFAEISKLAAAIKDSL